MFEDDKDKVRRNLVALSGFILASAYLDLKLPGQIFNVQLPKETNKIWVVVFFALLYAFWRFIHTKEAREARSSIASQYAACRIQVFNFLLTRDLKRVFHAKPPRWINASPIEARLEQERNMPHIQYVRLTALVPSQTHAWPHTGFEQRSGSTVVGIKFAFLYTAEMAKSMSPTSPNIEQQGGTNIDELPFSFPRWIEFFATLSSIAILLLRSEIIPEVLFPYGMAAGAGVIGLSRALS